MNKITLLIIITISSFVFAQSNEDVNSLQKHYQAFEYLIVIDKAENLLSHNGSMSENILTEIYTLKAASHFAVKEEGNARKSFIELLKVNSNYNIDDVMYSPKLVTFYNEVKEEFLDILKTEEKDPTPSELDDAKLKHQPLLINKNMNSAIARSIIIPGLGHLALGNTNKGWILTAASTAALGSMIYFIVDANNKESDYLAETNAVLIQQKYDKYDKSYKIRNLMIASYAAIWLYTQIDILFFSNQLRSDDISVNNFDNFYLQSDDQIIISFRLPI